LKAGGVGVVGHRKGRNHEPKGGGGKGVKKPNLNHNWVGKGKRKNSVKKDRVVVWEKKKNHVKGLRSERGVKCGGFKNPERETLKVKDKKKKKKKGGKCYVPVKKDNRKQDRQGINVP